MNGEIHYLTSFPWVNESGDSHYLTAFPRVSEPHRVW